MGQIREPIKKTSIAKKEKIIKMGFELMCEKGYHNVSCVDIAKYADVSTGIIYQYFNDKRDIFIEGTKDYANKIMFPMLDVIENKTINKEDLGKILEKMIDIFIQTHDLKKTSHEQLMAMSCLDNDIANIFNEQEMLVTDKISTILVNSGFNNDNIKEKVHVIMGIIENFCHEVVYHKHKSLDYNVMKKQILNIIINVLCV